MLWGEKTMYLCYKYENKYDIYTKRCMFKKQVFIFAIFI
jgi:hypothetical protein